VVISGQNAGRRGWNATAETDAVARKLVAEYNKGTPDWVEACHAEDSQWNELPLFGGHGRSGGRADLRKAAEGALAGFPDRKMTLLNVIAGGDQAAIEVEWNGSAGQDSERFRKGERFSLRIVFVIKVRDGQIVRQTDYCIPV
jgi:ketosteroid isomerase-like protein